MRVEEGRERKRVAWLLLLQRLRADQGLSGPSRHPLQTAQRTTRHRLETQLPAVPHHRRTKPTGRRKHHAHSHSSVHPSARHTRLQTQFGRPKQTKGASYRIDRRAFFPLNDIPADRMRRTGALALFGDSMAFRERQFSGFAKDHEAFIHRSMESAGLFGKVWN